MTWAFVVIIGMWLLVQWISVVQKAGLGQSSNSSSQGSGAFASNTTAGNMLIGFAWVGAAASPNRTVSSVTGGGTFQLAIHAIFTNINSGWGDVWMYFAPSIAGGSTTAVTFNLSGTVTDFDVGCLEVNGVNSLDQTNHNDNVAIASGGTTVSTGSITPSQAASLILGLWTCTGSIAWSAGPTGYTNQFQDTGATFEAGSADTDILSSSSAQNPSWKISNQVVGGCACIASFISSTGATPVKPLLVSQEVIWPMHQEQSMRYRRKLWPVPALEIPKSRIVLGTREQLLRLKKAC